MALQTMEATAVFKGMEMTHGNSTHYITFELENEERVYFQVSMKIYMLIIEGDLCRITYRAGGLGKNKLKSFERIAKPVPATTVENDLELDTTEVLVKENNRFNEEFDGEKETESTDKTVENKAKRISKSPIKKGFLDDDDELPMIEKDGYKPHKLLQKLEKKFSIDDDKFEDDFENESNDQEEN